MMWRKAASTLRTSYCRWRILTRGHHCDAKRPGYIQFSDEVAGALREKQPVVALESTIITHGMPYPDNLRTAQMVENVVRQNGATPATVAVIRGQIHVGLTNEELENLSQVDTGCIKTSRRDLPYVISQRLTGGTTVSGTMIAAHAAGIPVFVTGGVGGVHRGAETTMDVSADLTELGRTPVAVVSAGVKSILDIGRTLEYLETEGVCVSTFGKTKDFPAFFTPTSGFKSPYNVETPRQAAQLIDTTLALGLGSGMLIAVPIPTEEAATGAEIEAAIQTALREAQEKGIAGKDVTPYILARVNELTEGRSLAANIALVKNNARVGSQIAVELSRLQNETPSAQGQQRRVKVTHGGQPEVKDSNKSRPVVVGGINVDFTARFRVPKPKTNGATYPGDVGQTFGGVGRNLASCLSRLGDEPFFLSAMGKDNYSDYFFQHSRHMDLSGVRLCDDVPSAIYCAILEADGELLYGMGDFKVHERITPDYISKFQEQIASAPLVCMDGNIPAETIAYIADLCHDCKVPVWFEPTDLHHATKPVLTGAHQRLTYTSPNMNELRMLTEGLLGQSSEKSSVQSVDEDRSLEETLAEAVRLVRPLVDHVPNILLTLGQYGAMLVTQERSLYCSARPSHLSPPNIASVSGAGDCLAAGFISSLISGSSPETSLKAGILASQHSLQSRHAVPVSMTRDVISVTAIQGVEPWEVREVVM